jgi:hypothetical protein
MHDDFVFEGIEEFTLSSDDEDELSIDTLSLSEEGTLRTQQQQNIQQQQPEQKTNENIQVDHENLDPAIVNLLKETDTHITDKKDLEALSKVSVSQLTALFEEISVNGRKPLVTQQSKKELLHFWVRSVVEQHEKSSDAVPVMNDNKNLTDTEDLPSDGSEFDLNLEELDSIFDDEISIEIKKIQVDPIESSINEDISIILHTPVVNESSSLMTSDSEVEFTLTDDESFHVHVEPKFNSSDSEKTENTDYDITDDSQSVTNNNTVDITRDTNGYLSVQDPRIDSLQVEHAETNTSFNDSLITATISTDSSDDSSISSDSEDESENAFYSPEHSKPKVPEIIQGRTLNLSLHVTKEKKPTRSIGINTCTVKKRSKVSSKPNTISAPNSPRNFLRKTPSSKRVPSPPEVNISGIYLRQRAGKPVPQKTVEKLLDTMSPRSPRPVNLNGSPYSLKALSSPRASPRNYSSSPPRSARTPRSNGLSCDNMEFKSKDDLGSFIRRNEAKLNKQLSQQ